MGQRSSPQGRQYGSGEQLCGWLTFCKDRIITKRQFDGDVFFEFKRGRDKPRLEIHCVSLVGLQEIKERKKVPQCFPGNIW